MKNYIIHAARFRMLGRMYGNWFRVCDQLPAEKITYIDKNNVKGLMFSTALNGSGWFFVDVKYDSKNLVTCKHCGNI